MAEGEAPAAHLSLHRPGAGYGRAERGDRDADMVPGRPGAEEDRTQPKGAEADAEASAADRNVGLAPYRFGPDRKSVVKGKSVHVRVDLGDARIIKTKKH